MYRVHPKHHQHIFSPLSMLYNYVNQTKQAIEEFLKEYLKPQGRSILLSFNRYMILIVILNIDIKFLILIIIICFIVVKVMKLKPWSKNSRIQQLPQSYILKLNQINKNQLKQKTNQHQQNIQNKQSSLNREKQLNQHKSHQSNQINSSTSQHSQLNNNQTTNNNNNGNHIIQKNNVPPKSSNNYNNNDNQHKSIRDTTIITNLQPEGIQEQIYNSISQLTKMYSKFVWFVKTKSILFMWALVLIIYFFQPNLSTDTYHIITSTEDGILQIQSIKRVQEYVNYFQLICIWIVGNLIVFYRNGTKMLKTQLRQQLYTKEYTYKLIKKKKLKVNRLYSKVDQVLIKTSLQNRSQDQENQSQLLTDKKYHTFILKKKSPAIDIRTLKQFAQHLKHPSYHTNDNDPQKLITHPDYSEQITEKGQTKDQLCSPLSSQLNRRWLNNSKSQINTNFVLSQSQEQQDSEQVKDTNNLKDKITVKHTQQKNKPLLQTQHQQTQLESIKTMTDEKIVDDEPKQNKIILHRKNNFLPIISNSNDKLFRRKRKPSQSSQNHQQYNDFKISLVKDQISNKNKNQIEQK